jgi:choloylglycine hydrolase
MMCEDFRIKSQDNSVIFCGHSMQFPECQTSEVVTFNRDTPFASQAPDETKGLEWVSKYGFTGISAFHIDAPDTGMNEVGLSFSLLMLDETIYPKVPDGQNDRALSTADLGKYLLSCCATVEEVKEALSNVHVYGQAIKQMGKTPPGLHFALHDAQGNDLVIEFIDGKRVFHNNNKHGVLTNDPPFPEQIKNLKQYKNITPTDAMTDLPGSWTPQDRFVRLALEVKEALKTSTQNILHKIVKILNATDLPIGVETCQFNTETCTVTTRWQSIMNLKDKIFLFRPHGDTTFRRIDLNKLVFDHGTKHEKIPVWTKEMTVIDITDAINPSPFPFFNIKPFKSAFEKTVQFFMAKLEYPSPSTEKTKQVAINQFPNEDLQKNNLLELENGVKQIGF